MNQNILTSTNKLVLGLLAVSTIGLISLPAKADDALIQESVQESYTTGAGNVSVQNSRQQNRQSTYNRDGYGYYENNKSTGIVQRSQQLCDQYGEYNACVQDAEQSNVTRTRRSRH